MKSHKYLLALTLSALLCTGCAPAIEMRSAYWHQAEQYVGFGALELEQGRLEAAERWFGLALEVEQLPAALDGLGCLAFRRQNYSQARRYFEAAIALDESYYQALANLAQVEEHDGNHQRALELYARVLEQRPTHVAARNNLAVLLEEQGKLTVSELREELLRANLIEYQPIVIENIQKVEESWHE
jgi:tetratricopeptide (TPR) repeat protein